MGTAEGTGAVGGAGALGLLTVQDIANQLGCDVSRVHYVLKRDGVLPAAEMAGAKFFTANQVPALQRALARKMRRGRPPKPRPVA